MRHILLLLGMVFFVTGISSAQSSPANPLLLAAPFSMSSTGAVSTGSTPSSSSTSVSLAPVMDSSTAVTLAPNPFSSASAASPSADPQYVQGVFTNYNWQAYIGYSFFHFNGQHGNNRNMNGFNYSIVYYFNSWFGLDGEMMATHDNFGHTSDWFLFGGGGPRVRWLAPKGIEVWGHALIAFSHLTPQTPFGKQEALAYELGGGADFPTPLRRLSLRVGADMVGTQYFHENQFSPKAFVGGVFKF